MRIDNLPEPETIWYEDENGGKLPFDLKSCEHPTGWKYQHAYSAVVTESICGHYRDAKWPIRAIMFVVRMLPNSWKQRNSQICCGSSTINCVYPIVKYLVDKRGWRFTDACIASSKLCERCLNICLWEVEGQDLRFHQHYLDTVRTTCDSCWDIDPDYRERKRVKACYSALKYGTSVKEAWKTGYHYAMPHLLKEQKSSRFMTWINKILSRG